ncbi:carboxymuconolactone decarboxylase family protein [Actinomycetes bacterium M1A6_2h]
MSETPDFDQDASSFERGMAYLEHSQGEKVAARIEDSLMSGSRSFAEYSITSTYGDVFTRPGLDLRTRQLATIAILATLGGTEAQIKLHIRAALHNGTSADEIVELIIQVAAYAGAPRGSNAFLAAREVFDREGLSPK